MGGDSTPAPQGQEPGKQRVLETDIGGFEEHSPVLLGTCSLSKDLLGCAQKIVHLPTMESAVQAASVCPTSCRRKPQLHL